MLRELLPRFDIEELVEEFKLAGGGLKPILEAVDTYSGKHYNRADRNLKRTFYVNYVLSQMTLLEDKKLDAQKETEANKAETTAESTTKQQRKRDKKSEKKSEAKTAKARKNLFSDK